MISEKQPYTPNSSDEIDLFELAITLWKEKFIIIVMTVLATLIAVGYVFMTTSTPTPTYQAKASVLPPSISDITEINKAMIQHETRGNLEVYDVYAYFTNALRSNLLKDQFYQKYYAPQFENQGSMNAGALRNALNNQLTIDIGHYMALDKNDRFVQTGQGLNVVTVTLPENAELTQEWANLYIELAGDKAKEDLLQDRKADIAESIATLNARIALLRTQAKATRELEQVRLKEALKIAQEIGIEDNILLEKQNHSAMNSNQLYLMGATELTAQLEALELRESDDLYIPEIAGLQQQLAFYNSISFDPDKISMYTFDDPARYSELPVKKSNKKLIIVIGFLLGGMLGVAIALLKTAIRNRRLQMKNQ